MSRTRSYKVRIPGRPARTARTLRAAEAVTGRLMAGASPGTIGTIDRDGETVVLARYSGLGWTVIA